ncbi:MAG: hypothetical protein WEA58_00560 [Balneolaceae bacterium]
MESIDLINTDFIFDDRIEFINRAKNVFRYQIQHHPAYKIFSDHFAVSVEDDSFLFRDIPLLPIRAFKETKLIIPDKSPELTFKSSGTSSMKRSHHYIADSNLYKKAILSEFNHHFDLSNSVILGYTPGYNENKNSSLIWMINLLIEESRSELSQFLPLDVPLDDDLLAQIEKSGKNLILFGAAFGLLDLIDFKSVNLGSNTSIIETGGMKTQRREMNKSELRKALSNGFGIPEKKIHSEYGMCELLSQFYAIGSEKFCFPHWTHVSIRDPKDSTRICQPGEEGKIGIIDLANIYSCPFILTDDRGVMDEEGRFKVLGRWNSSDLRGCNFLIDVD